MPSSKSDSAWVARLPARNFFRRLCLVKTCTDNDAAAVETGDEVNAYKLWPALKFDSHKELLEHVMSLEGLENISRVRGKLTVQFAALVRTAPTGGKTSAYAVAYLLGKGGVDKSMTLLPKTKEGELLDHTYDFCMYVDEMMQGEGHCATEEFQEAFELAIDRMQAATEAAATPAKVKREKEATLTTVSSGRKTFTNVDYAEGYVSPRKQSKAVAKKEVAREPEEDEPLEEEEEEAHPEIKSVQFRENEAEDAISSPEKPLSQPSDDESQADHFSPSVARGKSQRCPSIDGRGLTWAEMHKAMKAEGWYHITGTDFTVPYYYTHPTCKGMKKMEILKTKTEGVDYFTEDALKAYARVNYGWTGEGGEVRVASPKDAEMADRIKKRKRGATKPPAEDAKKEKAKAKAKAAKGKTPASKQAKKSGKIPIAVRPAPGSPGSQGSEESRFSDNSVAKNTRSQMGSPTFSELEADVGITKSARKKSRAKQLRFSQEPEESTEECASPEQSTSSGSRGSGTSESEASSLDESFEIMANSAAWRLLMDRFGFGFSNFGGKDVYCLPGKENKPGKDSNAEEGVNYFASLVDLRENLCAYGLPDLKKNKGLDGDETDDLELWVRYAHVRGLRDGSSFNPKDVGGEYISGGREAWSMLTKLGCKWSGSCYVVPNSDPSKASFRFERDQDYLKHLARFGIPRVPGIEPDEVLTGEDRLLLDLYIVGSAEVDTFERIDPSSEGVHEISPRRSRSRRSSANESEPAAVKAAAQPKRQTNKGRAYQMEFNELANSKPRSMPSRLMSSKEALAMLVENYNFSVMKREDRDYYCLPKVGFAESEDCVLGRDYFETVQEMRENLCAYGLPSIAKDARLSADDTMALESWVRCAHIDLVGSGIPECDDMKPKEARSVLKGLGYCFSDNVGAMVLPGTSLHNAKPGVDRFDKLIGLFNHIARFGLDADTPESELGVSKEERLKLQVFVASVATFDVRKRIRCDAPIKKRSMSAMQEGAATTKSATATLSTKGEEKATDAAVSATPAHPAVVESDHDTPKPSPPKKPRTNQKKMTSFLANVSRTLVNGVAGVFGSPTPQYGPLTPLVLSKQKADAALTTASSSSIGSFSHSTIGQKGDDEAEAGLAGPSNDDAVLTQVDSQKESDFLTPKIQRKTLEIAEQSAPAEESSAITHYPQAESPDMEWKDLWRQMRKAGWRYIDGNDLVAWFWVHPSAAKLGKNDLLSKREQGVHYFTSEEDIQRYAVKHLGWEGEVPEPSPTTTDMSMAARVRKRNQGNAPKSEAAPSPLKKARTSSEGSKISVALKSPGSQSGDNSSVSSRSSKGSKAYKAAPDKERTVRDKLECCQMVLHPAFKKAELSKSSVSVVSSKEDDIKDFITQSIETGMTADGLTLPSPGFLYICGGPGTGKTTAVMSCVADMKKWAKKNGYEKPGFCSINMASIAANCKGGLMKSMLKKMAKELGVDAETAKLPTYEKKLEKKVFVLILDEIDMLFKTHGGIGETWFRTLVEWAENKELRFSMIGISNCVNDVNATRVREMGHSPRELVFAAYKEEDIVAILEERLGKNVIDPKALQLISRKVAASSGDARRALEITSNAVGKCLELLSDAKLDAKVKEDDECMPLVKLPHMMRAIREGMPLRHGDVICGLPQAAKVILCIAVSLSRVWGPTAEISVSTLKKYCVEATHHAIMDELGLGQIINLVEMLVDSGLLVAGDDGRINRLDANAKLKIGVQMDDVEIALEQSLMKEGTFYRSLADYVKRECPR